MPIHKYIVPKRPRRSGLIQLEIVVSAMLLGAILSCVVALNYRLLAVAKDTKHYQVALHEAANQVVMLTAKGRMGLEERIAKVKLSDDLLQVLPEGKIDVERFEEKEGTRVVVRIGWQRPGAPTSVELTGWVTAQEDRP